MLITFEWMDGFLNFSKVNLSEFQALSRGYGSRSAKMEGSGYAQKKSESETLLQMKQRFQLGFPVCMCKE